jgi:hypothetical protein
VIKVSESKGLFFIFIAALVTLIAGLYWFRDREAEKDGEKVMDWTPPQPKSPHDKMREDQEKNGIYTAPPPPTTMDNYPPPAPADTPTPNYPPPTPEPEPEPTYTSPPIHPLPLAPVPPPPITPLPNAPIPPPPITLLPNAPVYDENLKAM